MMEKVRTAMIGTGIIAHAHALGLKTNPDAVLCALCDIKAEKMQSFAEEMDINGASMYTDYREMIDHESLDAVYICTPTVSHCEIALYAMAKGLHVFCEKTTAMNAAQAQQMAAAAQAAGVVSRVGFAFRFIPAVNYIKDLIDSGKLGEIRYFRGRFFANRLAPEDHPMEWRHLKEIAGSGVIGDLICHVLDMGHYLLFDYEDITGLLAGGNILLPERTDPESGSMRAVTAEENLVLMLNTKQKIQVTLEASRYIPFEMSFQISGTKGSVKYSMEHYNECETIFYEREGVYSQRFSQTYERKEIPQQYLADPKLQDRFIRQCFAFTDQILGKCAGGADFEEGLKNQRLLDRIQSEMHVI